MRRVHNELKRLILAICTASVLAPGLVFACTKTPFTVQRFTSSTVSFVGTSSADTLRAGPDDVRFEPPEVPRVPSTRTVYGQRVRVERVAEYAREMLPSGVREVVLIPWSYGSGCQPIVWLGSARWITSGTRGVFTAELRERSHWVDGVPTLDVFSTQFVPTRSVKPNSRNGELPELSADELLDVASHVPDPELLKRDPENASRDFLEWARANAHLSKRVPAAGVVNDVVYDVREAMVRQARVDIAGTWKFTVSVEGEPLREFYARTEAIATEEWRDGSPEGAAMWRNREPWDVLPLGGYNLMTGTRLSLGQLPTGCMRGNGSGRMYQRAIGVSGSTPNRIRGEMELGWVNSAFGGDTTFSAYIEKKRENAADSVAYAGASAAARAAGVRVGKESVVFETGADGVMRVEQGWWLGEGRVVVVRGERVSGVVGKCG
jgi:hypothetical protein